VRADPDSEKKVTIPDNWLSKREIEVTTRTKLLESRKKEARPDISYDLDGDGTVSHKDLFLAK